MPAEYSPARACPACNGLAEPEEDGDLTYHVCALCGHEFGYYRRVRAVNAKATCAAGIPLADAQPAPPLLQIGKRPADA